MQPSETGISVTKAGSLSICQRWFLHILRAHKLFCRPQVSGINNVMLGLLVAIIRGYTMLYYAILPFVYPTNSSVEIWTFPYKLSTGRDWRNRFVLVMGRFLQERAALASKGRHQRLHIFLAVLAHSFGPLGAKSLPPNGFCRPRSHSTPQRRWQCCGLRKEWFWTMRHSTFGRRDKIYAGFCRQSSYSTSQEWWRCCDLRNELVWTMRHSAVTWWNDIHPGFCRHASHSTS